MLVLVDRVFQPRGVFAGRRGQADHRVDDGINEEGEDAAATAGGRCRPGVVDQFHVKQLEDPAFLEEFDFAGVAGDRFVGFGRAGRVGTQFEFDRRARGAHVAGLPGARAPLASCLIPASLQSVFLSPVASGNQDRTLKCGPGAVTCFLLRYLPLTESCLVLMALADPEGQTELCGVFCFCFYVEICLKFSELEMVSQSSAGLE